VSSETMNRRSSGDTSDSKEAVMSTTNDDLIQRISMDARSRGLVPLPSKVLTPMLTFEQAAALADRRRDATQAQLSWTNPLAELKRAEQRGGKGRAVSQQFFVSSPLRGVQSPATTARPKRKKERFNELKIKTQDISDATDDDASRPKVIGERAVAFPDSPPPAGRCKQLVGRCGYPNVGHFAAWTAAWVLAAAVIDLILALVGPNVYPAMPYGEGNSAVWVGACSGSVALFVGLLYMYYHCCGRGLFGPEPAPQSSASTDSGHPTVQSSNQWVQSNPLYKV
jgi:hypothetical protein